MVGPLTALLALWAQAAEGDQEAVQAPADAALSCARWRDETRFLDKPEWITHVVRPRERLAQIAVRYGVTKQDLATWNKLSSPRARVRAGKKLKVRTAIVPPPREKVVYAAAAGEDWSEVAIRHRVAIEDLKAWNSEHRGQRLAAGTELKIWIDPGEPRTVNCARGEPPPPLEYRDDADSLGHPQSGRLRNGIKLPDWPMWTKGNPRGLYASSHTLDVMVAAFTQLRVDNGYEGAMFIGSIARRRGGYFPPHRSHRTGLDIDIRLPLLPTVAPETYPTADNVDWPALWELVEAFVDTGEVSMIFLDHKMQKYLYRAARWAGKTPEELETIVHWPRKDRKWEVIVRHSRGHKGHIHVRLLCGVDEPRCGPKRATTLERRGWIEPHPSGEASREGARARREQWKLEGRLSDEDEGAEDDEE